MTSAATSPDHEPRFAFGANWRRFLATVDETRITAAEQSLREMLHCERLDGLRLIDVGSGSGLFSLAAHRLGATVHSFDYDPQSVACTEELRRRFGRGAPDWTVEAGSALDADYLSRLGTADVVYSWGVLHHTGEMWRAVDLTATLVAPGGRLWIALYNDQGRASEQWKCVKRMYQWLPRWLRPVLTVLAGGAIVVHRVWQTVVTMLLRLLTFQNPLAPARSLAAAAGRADARGMHRWYDLVDWVGGWPFEVAKPEEVFDRLRAQGFVLEELRTCGGRMGCNEFVFRRSGAG